VKKREYLFFCIIVSVLLLTSLRPVSALNDWSDNFDDGNYDGWTVFTGAFAVNGGKLEATSLSGGNGAPWITHPSSVDFGNWTFDIDLGVNATGVRAVIAFMASEHGIGPCFYLDAIGIGWDLYRGAVSPPGLTGDDSLGHFTATVEWEHHIRVERTRAEPSIFRVYHNGTLVIETSYVFVPDNDWTLFEFGGIPGTPGASIDNIVVEYEEFVNTTTETTPTSSTTTPPPGEPLDMTTILLLAGGAAVVVIVLVAIVKLRS